MTTLKPQKVWFVPDANGAWSGCKPSTPGATAFYLVPCVDLEAKDAEIASLKSRVPVICKACHGTQEVIVDEAVNSKDLCPDCETGAVWEEKV